MLDGLEEYLSDGGRHMYLGGNGYYWITSFVTDSPHCIEVRRHRGTEAWEADPGEYYHASTGEIGGLWRFRGRPPQKLVGVGFSSQGFDYDRPYDIQAESSDPRAEFIFKGVDKSRPLGDYGLIQGAAAGFEIDRADIDLGTPPHALVLATATGFSDLYQHVIEEALLMDGMQGGTVNPMVKSDIVFYEGPKGGAVFSVGSISWCGSLSHNNYNNDISRITGNVLDRFISEDEI
jgi:N,N-dimethylformamidase